MPGIVDWATLRGSKHMNLQQSDRASLTLRGSALPSPKRLPSERLLEAGLRAGRSKVLQENHPYGPGFIFADSLIF